MSEHTHSNNENPERTIKSTEALHTYDDLDQSDSSHHHTLGTQPNQASAGNHQHDGISGPSIASTTVTASAVGDVANAGTATKYSRGDHKHGRESFGSVGTSAPGDSATDGVATTVSHSDHKHGRESFGLAADISTVIETAASAGVSTKVARADHLHAAQAGFVGNSAVGDTNTAGASTQWSRADHRHGRESFGTPTSTSAVGDSASDGVATTLSRSDHKHGREGFGAPGSSAVGDTVNNGVATTLSRSDHRHGREAFAAPGSSAVGDAINAGVATTLARSDHVHGREAFSAHVDLTTVNTAGADGAATTLARSNHLHSIPIATVHDQAAYSNATTGFTDVTGMTATLLANGIYEVEYVGFYQASAVTVALKLNIPAQASVVEAIISEIYTTTGATAPSASMGYSVAGVAFAHTGPVVTVANTNFCYRMKCYVKVGAANITWKLQAAASAAGSITFPAGGYWQKVTRLA